MNRTLLQQALDALHPQARPAFVEATKDALSAALAQPEPEPVAIADGTFNCSAPLGTLLYAAPPAAPAPAGLTPFERDLLESVGQMKRGEGVQVYPPAPAVPSEAALNTLARLFHNGEEIEGDDGAAMMVDLSLWHEASEAFDSLIGDGDGETLASSAAPAVREPQPEVLQQVMTELDRATRKFPKWPTDPLHALAVLGEEFGELTKAMLQFTYEPHKKVSRTDIREEAIQTAAMALRLAMSLPLYDYAPGPQHKQHGIGGGGK